MSRLAPAIAASLLIAGCGQPAPEASPSPQASTGAITGALGYPSNFVPALSVYAIKIDQGSQPAWLVKTQPNAPAYTIRNLPPGVYNVFAYASPGFAGGYTNAVPCGLSISCTDHRLIAVSITAGKTVGGADVRDFYAPAGAFPPEPKNASPGD
jgi:hypothetical protein